jgi:hypothetical protein
VAKVTNDFGTGLTLSGNASITGLNTSVGNLSSQVASNFVVNTQYHTGDVVRYGDNLYVFTNDYSGDWAHAPVSQTNLSGQVSSLNSDVATMGSQYSDMSSKYTTMQGLYQDIYQGNA